MATDFGEKERAFIEGLKENTGRDLAEWMQAISAAGLPHRNDVIDWLRHKGLMFSKASWLERIHHNGGNPIYAGAPHDARPRRPPTRGPRPQPPQSQAAAPRVASPAPAPQAAPPTSPGLDDLLAKAKAYRPLAQHVVAKIRALRPAARLEPHEAFVVVADPAPFAVLAVSPKELRLHLALGDLPVEPPLKKGAAGAGLGKEQALSHMLVLTDARQVDQRLLDLIGLAAKTVNG
jgi:hypothetical protein